MNDRRLRGRERQRHFLLTIPYRFIVRDLAGVFFTLVTSLTVYAIERELERSPATKYIDSILALISIITFLAMSYPIAEGTTLILLQVQATILLKLHCLQVLSHLFLNRQSLKTSMWMRSSAS